MSSKNKDVRYATEDHICMGCGGRILRQTSPGIVSPGGNPLFKCSLCNRATTGMDPSPLCWCGFKHKGQGGQPPYICMRTSLIEDVKKLDDGEKKAQDLDRAFRACGIDPTKTQVGILLTSDYSRIFAPKTTEQPSKE